MSYAALLQCTPSCSAALLLTTSRVPCLSQLQQDIRCRLKEDWQLVLEMESSAAGATTLHRLCPQTKWQVFREICVVLESNEYKTTQEVLSVIEAWFPRLAFSANIEDQFSSMEDIVKRGNRSQMNSMPNLCATAVRSLYHKLLDGPGQAKSVKLTDADWEGSTVRGLKQKLFQPDTFTGSNPSSTVVVCCELHTAANIRTY